MDHANGANVWVKVSYPTEAVGPLVPSRRQTWITTLWNHRHHQSNWPNATQHSTMTPHFAELSGSVSYQLASIVLFSCMC